LDFISYAVHGAHCRWKKALGSSGGHWMEEDETRYTFHVFTVVWIANTGEEILGFIEDIVHEDTTLAHLRYLLHTVFPHEHLQTAYVFKNKSGKVCYIYKYIYIYIYKYILYIIEITLHLLSTRSYPTRQNPQ
jgi:hypothetical protein